MDIKHFGNKGVASGLNQYFTFELCDKSSQSTLSRNNITSIVPNVFQLGEFYIPAYGHDNKEPNRVKSTIGKNRLLPELIEKQVRFLYGSGLYTYRTEYIDNKPVRVPERLPDVMKWQSNWREKGIKDSIDVYVNKAIREFYYMDGIWTKFRMNKSRRIGADFPIAGLEVVNSTRCRFATKFQVEPNNYEDTDFKLVLVGDWENPIKQKMKIYPRFDFENPHDFGTAITYSRNPSFGEELYAYNKYFKGIEEWLIGSNLTPGYINSFYQNSLSAKIHVIIPYSWVEKKKSWLQDICSENSDRKEHGKELIKVNGIEVGIDYSEEILNKYIDSEIEVFTEYLSGVKNQGKAYFSYSTSGDDGKELAWKIEEIPLKYKEYITTLIDYDKRADEVLLSSKGIDASISNVSKDGITSNSGADVFYNYMIYISTLYIAEMIVLDALQYAFKHNFPNYFDEGYSYGLLSLNNVKRQEDTTPKNRMQNNNV